MTNYDNNSIRTRSDLVQMRTNPSLNLGTNDARGVLHAIKEIIDNSIDEVKSGYGEEVIITRYKDRSYSVQDFGRGVPVDWNEAEQKYNYELVFMTLNAGGKYEEAGKTGASKYSKGLHGIGASACAFTSEHFEVTSVRDNKEYNVKLYKGELESFDSEPSDKPTGTFIKWNPDLEVFKDVKVDIEDIKFFAKEQAVVNKGLKVTVIDEMEDTQISYQYNNGIMEFLEELSEGTQLTTPQYFEIETSGREREDLEEYDSLYQVAFVASNEHNQLLSYHNSSYLRHGGSPHEAVKSAFAYMAHKYANENNLYKKKEKRISWEDLSESLIVVTNTYSEYTSYEHQTKEAINNEFIKVFMNEWLREKLEIYFTENPKEAKRLVEQALVNKRASERAENTRKKVQRELSKEVNNLTQRVEKFVNCESSDSNERELFILEGDSALTSIKDARNPDTQALYPLRGKLLNVAKAKIDRVLANKEITDIFRLIGAGIEVRDSKAKTLNTFNIDNLAWNKIILTADQDVDGGHINALLLTFLYKFMPQLIEGGYVYVAVSPLFIAYYKDEKIYAYNDLQLNQIIKEKGKPTLLQRSKGLGENDAEIMYETVTNPETRNLIQVTMDNYNELQSFFEVLMGDDLESRKEIVAEHLKDYVANLD